MALILLLIVLLSVVTTLSYLFDTFYYFFVNNQFWNAKFQDVNANNRSHLLVPKSKKVEVNLGVKKVIWSCVLLSLYL